MTSVEAAIEATNKEIASAQLFLVEAPNTYERMSRLSHISSLMEHKNTLIDTQIERARTALAEGPNGSERMSIISHITSLMDQKENPAKPI